MDLFKKRVPEVFQVEAAECGAASLCMILGYYGRYIDLTEMRRDCHISRDGSRMSYIMAAARKHGMQADAYRSDPSLTGRKLPAIVFWNYCHFLVVEELTEKYVYLVDPAFGRRKITREEFARSFSGVVLELQCTDKFEQCGKPDAPFSQLISMMKVNKGAILYLVILTTMINLVGLILPAFTTLFVDYYIPYIANANMLQYFSAFFVVLVIQALLLLLRRHVNLRFMRIQSADMTGKLVQKLLKLPVSYFGTRSHSVIDAHLKGIDGLTDFVGARLVPMILDLIFSGVYILLLFAYSYVVAVPTLILILMIIGLIALLLKMTRTAIIYSANMQNDFYGSVVQNVRLFDTIRSVAMEDEAFMHTMQKFSAWQNASWLSKKMLSVLQAVPVAVPLLIQVFVIAAGSSEVIYGRMTIGNVLACQTIAMSVFAPVVTTISEFNSLQGQEIQIRAFKDIVNESDDPVLNRDVSHHEEKLSGEIELKNVSFGYNTMLPPVVDDISLHIAPGHSAALAGGSGSGKSTILKLLEGLYSPQKGEILLDGIPHENFDHCDLADSIAVVSQSPFIFTGTIRENITLFDRSIDMHRVTGAAKAACVFDAIEAHPGGFNAMISPTNCSFSGGEIQRIMIARALVRKPSILIMDEATSALDTVVEQQIMENVRAMNITLLVVAHRLSAIRDCDEILVLEKGRIAQRGSHDELAAQEGLYRQLMSSEEQDE